MKKNHKKHINYYAVLIIMLFLVIFMLLSLSGYKDIQLIFIAFAAAAYIVWGLIHHWLEHSLNSKIVLEYLLFGLLGLIISLFYFK